MPKTRLKVLFWRQFFELFSFSFFFFSFLYSYFQGIRWSHEERRRKKALLKNHWRNNHRMHVSRILRKELCLDLYISMDSLTLKGSPNFPTQVFSQFITTFLNIWFPLLGLTKSRAFFQFSSDVFANLNHYKRS